MTCGENCQFWLALLGSVISALLGFFGGRKFQTNRRK